MKNPPTSVASGDGHKMSDPELSVRQSSSVSLLDYPDTDSGNAERLAALYSHRICYRSDGKCWHIYDRETGVWKEAHEDEIKGFARRTVRQFRDELGTQRHPGDSRLEFAFKSENSSRLNNLVREARTLPKLRVPSKNFDADPLLLNAKNGVVDLKTGMLREHTPEDFFTRTCGAKYVEGSNAPKWEAFLRTIFDGDEELVDYVQRIAGYALSGLATEQCMFVLKGDGANGKSTFLEVLREVFGDYAANTPVQTLLPGSRQGHDADLARLPNVRFLTVNELERDEKLVESRVKRLTGQDRMAVRDMYEGYFEYTPDFAIFMATNHWPKASADDYALWRRLHVIPFAVRIPPVEQDPLLKRKLLKESGGILAWAVGGFRKWKSDPLQNQPPASKEEKDRWRDKIDRCVSTFVRKCLARKTGASVRTRRVHDVYADYSSSRDMEPLSHRQLNMRIEHHFDGSIYKKRTGAGGSAHWIGLELYVSGK